MPDLKPCGTFAAWQRHRKYGEKPCEPCRIAKNRYKANSDRIKEQAVRALIHLHRPDYLRLLNRIREEEKAPR